LDFFINRVTRGSFLFSKLRFNRCLNPRQKNQYCWIRVRHPSGIC